MGLYLSLLTSWLRTTYFHTLSQTFMCQSLRFDEPSQILILKKKFNIIQSNLTFKWGEVWKWGDQESYDQLLHDFKKLKKIEYLK